MIRARSFGSNWLYIAAAAVGYLLGSLVVPAFVVLAGTGASSALSRVGFALQNRPQAPPAAWSALEADLHPELP